MSALNLKDFKPTIFFLLKFVALYLVLNVWYGLYIKSERPNPDAATISVTNQSAAILNGLGWETQTVNNPKKPTTAIIYGGKPIVSVYEGCNGINVAIIFICFLVAFGPLNKKLIWFSLIGVVVIHLVNLGRIIGLFWVVLYLPGALYFTHKYLFTAIIYVGVFVMWLIWLRMNFKKS